MKARYKCKTCGYEWEGEKGPVTCPVCGGVYVDWVDYEEDGNELQSRR